MSPTRVILEYLTLGAHAQRGLQYSCSLSVCVCACLSVSVTSLTATPLTHRYKVRYESNANALLKVFDSWISQKKYFVEKLRRYLLTSTNFDGFDGKELHQKDYWRLLVG